MRSEAHTRSYWVILPCAFLGAAAFLFASITLILEAITGHGSPAGNVLRVGLAVLFLFIGFFFVAVGMLYRMSFEEDRGNEFR